MTSTPEKQYEALKDTLKAFGWKEQDSGEVTINGEVGTNFIKDGEIIRLGFCLMPDEEELENFEEK